MADQILRNAGFMLESKNVDRYQPDIRESWWCERRHMRLIFLGKRVEIETYNEYLKPTRAVIDLQVYRCIESKLKERGWI